MVFICFLAWSPRGRWSACGVCPTSHKNHFVCVITLNKRCWIMAADAFLSTPLLKAAFHSFFPKQWGDGAGWTPSLMYTYTWGCCENLPAQILSLHSLPRELITSNILLCPSLITQINTSAVKGKPQFANDSLPLFFFFRSFHSKNSQTTSFGLNK